MDHPGLPETIELLHSPRPLPPQLSLLPQQQQNKRPIIDHVQ